MFIPIHTIYFDFTKLMEMQLNDTFLNFLYVVKWYFVRNIFHFRKT